MNLNAALRNLRRVEMEAKQAVVNPATASHMAWAAQLITKLAESVQAIVDFEHPGQVKIARTVLPEGNMDWEY